MQAQPDTAFNYLHTIDFELTHEHGGHHSAEQFSKQYLHFRVADNDLLLELNSSIEVINSIDYSRIPRMQPWLLGMASLRGQLLPLIDLESYWFDVKAIQKLKNKRIICTKVGSIFLGLVVDQVCGIVNNNDMDEIDVSGNNWTDAVRQCLASGYSANDINYGEYDLSRMIVQDKFNSMQLTM